MCEYMCTFRSESWNPFQKEMLRVPGVHDQRYLNSFFCRYDPFLPTYLITHERGRR